MLGYFFFIGYQYGLISYLLDIRNVMISGIFRGNNRQLDYFDVSAIFVWLPILLYFDVCHNPLPYVVFWHQLPCSMDYILAFSLDWCFIIFHAHWFCLGLWILWFDIWYVSLILFYRASWISSWFDLWVMFCGCLSSSFALWLIVGAIYSFK